MTGPQLALRARRAADSGRAVLAAHPRHLVLLGLVGGLLLGSLSPVAVLGLAGLTALAAARPAVGLACVAAVLAGAAVGEARLAALDRGPLTGLAGTALEARVLVLEPVRERSRGQRAGRVEVFDGPAAGAQAAARIDPESGWSGRTRVGELVRVRGTVERLRPFEAYQRRRGAQAALEVEWARPTGLRRGGAAGDLDALRLRAERALANGVPAA